jgi:hypothetical protein
MKTASVVVISIAGILTVVAVAANGQMTAAPGTGLKTETVTDAAGNLHVPAAYRTTYESLGSWAVAAEQGQELKELHVVYASPGTIDAYRKGGLFPDGTVQPCGGLEGLVCHDEGQQRQSPRQQVVGQRLGLVMV